ncbi:hypothetical protein ACTYEO_10260 [Rhodophyticola sp. SM2404]
MKHLLTAALIATATASPVRGETYTVNCSTEDGSNYLSVLIDTTNQTLIVDGQNTTRDGLDITIWNDDYIGFQIMRAFNSGASTQSIALLNRNNGLMGGASVKFDAAGQLTFENLLWHCTRPL